MSRISLLKTLSRKGLLSIGATFLGIALSMQAQAQTITLDFIDGDDWEVSTPFGLVPNTEKVPITGTITAEGVDAVVIGLDGLIVGDAWSGSDGEIATITATFLLNVIDGKFEGELDFTKGESIAANSVNPITIHAFAFDETEDNYEVNDESFSGFIDSTSVDMTYTINDSNVFDGDDNGIPDADLLSILANGFGFNGFQTQLKPNGADPDYLVTRIVRGIDVGVFPASLAFSNTFIINGKFVYVDTLVPNLEWLKSHEDLDDDLADAIDAVLVVRCESDGEFILDGAANPAAEFDLGVTPRYYFHVTILLEVSPGVWRELALRDPEYKIDVLTRGIGFNNAIPESVKLFRYTTSTNQSGADNDGPHVTITGDVNGWLPIVPFTAFQTDGSGNGSITLRESIKGSLYAISYDLPDVDPPDPGGGANNGDRTGSGGSGGCFIATAAYGTPMAEEINALRGVRDTYMLNTTLGTAFVDTYYRVSPPVANFIADHAVLRAMVRAVLTPIVWVAQLVLAAPMLMLSIMAGMVLTLIATRRKKAIH